MNWQPTGYQSERYVDGDGKIVGEVAYRPGANEVAASLRMPYNALGCYVSMDAAKRAVERAAGLEELK